MNRLAVLVVLASGCHWIADLRNPPPPKPYELPATAHAELTSVQVDYSRGQELRVVLSHNVGEAWRTGSEAFELTGPGGLSTTDLNTSLDGGEGVLTEWHDEWPAGTYKLVFRAFGKVLAEREFTVAKPSTGRGTPYPVVVSNDRQLIEKSSTYLFTYMPVNVSVPAYAVQAVWLADHRVVDTTDEIVSIASLFDMGRVGEHVRLDVTSRKASDLDATPMTVMLFVNGAGFYGAWSRPAGEAHSGLALPAITPDPGDLAIARAAARKLATENGQIGSPLENAANETLACAIASDETARDAYATYQRAAFNGGIDDHRADEETTLADNDDSLTDRQRAKLRKDAALHRDYAGTTVQRQASGLALAKQRARKYKKGCLAAMGVPTLAPLPTH